MLNAKKLISLLLAMLILITLSSCAPVDKDYGVVKEPENQAETDIVTEDINKPIMSSDRVMSKYFDISVFDEENYADIYLGKKFKIDASFIGDEFEVPIKLSEMNKNGWILSAGNTHDENSLVFAYETVKVTFENQDGVKITAWFYNSGKSSKSLKECYIVKFYIENTFYQDTENYNAFNVNGITNTMAVTDVIYTLGTPSHFYQVSENNYYLDYFITKKDRRNGITVYIDLLNDSILGIEFSYYK